MPGISMLSANIITDFFSGLWKMIQVIILGIIEGITEWLPISSTGHLMLAETFLHPFGDPVQYKYVYELFDVWVQLGAICAVCVIYFHKLNPWSKGKTPGQKHQTWLLWAKVCVASIPIVIFGVLYEKLDLFDNKYRPLVIAIALIVYGLAFILVERYLISDRQPVNKFFKLSFETAFFIGMIQVLSLVPGTSRSGVTILGAMLLGCTRRVSAEYTFFLGIPAMFGASGLRLISTLRKIASKEINPIGGYNWFLLLLSMIVAFLVSMIAIRFLTDYVKRHDFSFFGWYRIVLGVIVLIAFFTIGLPA